MSAYITQEDSVDRNDVLAPADPAALFANGDDSPALFYPTDSETPGESGQHCASLLDELGLKWRVNLVPECAADNLKFLRLCVDREISKPEPYLQMVIGGCSVMALFYRGDDIRRELSALAEQIHAVKHRAGVDGTQ